MVDPAVKGTLGALKAAHKHKVKRVVVTSSFAAISVGHKPPPAVFNESVWSNIKMMEGMGIKLLGGYLLSKTLAEKAAWEYQRNLGDSERFDLICLCPPYVYGPSFVGSGFTSGDDLTAFMHGKKQVLKMKTPMVDVMSLAQAHLNAVEISEAANQRFMVLNGIYSTKEIADALSAEFSSQGWPINTKEEGNEVKSGNYDNSRSKNVLKVDYEPDMG